jgi:predicted nucleic acid-binding protein
VIRVGEAVFVDTGAWIALALTRDPLHARAAAAWADLLRVGARLRTSVPVVIEIRMAFAFDGHFAEAGFRMIG